MNAKCLWSVLMFGCFTIPVHPAGTVIELAGGTNRPVMVEGRALRDVIAVEVGEFHCLALKSDGTVAGWGWNVYGQATGVPSHVSSGSDKGSGMVRIDGQVLSNAVAIAAGRTQSIALKDDGTVVVWGAAEGGRRISVPPDLTNAVAVAAGWGHCLVLQRNGLVTWLDSEGARLVGGNAAAVACGKTYDFGARPKGDLVLTRDGSVAGLHGGASQERLPTGLTNVIAISSGGAADLVLTKDGRVFGWGVNDRGQATGVPSTNRISSGFVTVDDRVLTDVTAISAGNRDFSLALKKDGRVVAWGSIGPNRVSVPEGLSNVVAMAAGETFALFVTTNAP